ncbi:hypothetical protein [Streptomyces roseifaciens]|uniref:hypothetical protein n=1 Tax=Streptomyces roseifaciens TaxID=1488406 RepID=UPI000718162E|nr:hypothetical protein [Streptomyces roseifaciens]
MMLRWKYDVAIELNNEIFVSQGEITSNDCETEQSMSRAMVMDMVIKDPKLREGRLVRSNCTQIR